MSKLRRQAIGSKGLWKICEKSLTYFFLNNWEIKIEHPHPVHRTLEFCCSVIWELLPASVCNFPVASDLYIFLRPTRSYMIWPLPVSLRYHFLPSSPHFIFEENEAQVKQLVLLYTAKKWQCQNLNLWSLEPYCTIHQAVFSLNIIDKYITIRKS